MGSFQFQKQRFGDGVPLPVSPSFREVFPAKQGIHCHESSVETFQVNNGAAGEVFYPLEILRAEINPGYVVQPGGKGKAVGAADEGAGRVEEAPVICQKGAGAVR